MTIKGKIKKPWIPKKCLLQYGYWVLLKYSSYPFPRKTHTRPLSLGSQRRPLPPLRKHPRSSQCHHTPPCGAEPCAKREGEEKQLRTWKEARRQEREVILPSLARHSRRQRGGWLANTLFSENTHSSDRSHPSCQ